MLLFGNDVLVLMGVGCVSSMIVRMGMVRMLMHEIGSCATMPMIAIWYVTMVG